MSSMENKSQQTFANDILDGEQSKRGSCSEDPSPTDPEVSSSPSPANNSILSIPTSQRDCLPIPSSTPSGYSNMFSEKTIFDAKDDTFSVKNNYTMQGTSGTNDMFDRLRSKSGIEAFYQALLDKDTGRILECVKQGVSVNVIFDDELSNLQPGHKGLRALHIAAQRAKDSLPVMQYLVDLGADVRLRSRSGDTPLHTAAKHASISVIKFLLHFCPDLKDCTNNQQLTALMKAIFKYEFAWRGRYQESVKLLLEAGCNPNINPVSGISPLHLAVQKHDKILVQMLVDHGADVNAMCKQGTSPLLQGLLCKQVHEESLRILVAAKADVNIHTVTGLSALHLAVTRCDKECVEDFLRAGADPNMPDTKLVTPLWRAVEENNARLVPLLVQYGGNINYVLPSQQLSLLSRAVQEQSVNMTGLLLQLGASVRMATVRGETPLTIAVDRPGDACIPIVKLLLGANSDLDSLSYARNPLEPLTPVQVAFEHGNAEVVRLLIRAGCRVPMSWMYQHSTLPVIKSKPELLAWIVKYVSEVPPLTHLTRLMLRRYLGSDLLEAVQELKRNEIPEKIADFLLLKDLTGPTSSS